MEEFTEINVTPFTDVLLVLLIIFMIMAALVIPPGFEREFSCHCGLSASEAQIYRAQVTVEPNGRMLLEGRRVDQHSIYQAMSALHAAHRNVALDIVAAPRVPYALVIRVMDAAKEARISNVWFLTS